MEVLVKEIVNWMMGVEASASRIYEKAAKILAEDKELSLLLSGLAKDEKDHLHIIRDAAESIGDKKASPSLISLYNETKKNVNKFFTLCEERLAEERLTRKDAIDCMVSLEFSEYNHIFLYIIKMLEYQREKFISAGEELEQHREKIEEFLKKERNEYIDMIRPLPPLWQKKFLKMNDDEIIAGLTEQLLTFPKAEKKAARLIPIKKMLTDISELTVRGNGVECTLFVEENLGAVYADYGQIAQAINNIVLNVIHAIPKGEGSTIEVRAENMAVTDEEIMPIVNGNYVRISIISTGVCIERNQLEELFGPYYTNKKDGAGMEFASSYSIIKNHNGNIEIDSNEEAGTRFSIFLPALTGGGRRAVRRD